MSRIEKQFALMELQYLLGDHRASDRRQADALVVRVYDSISIWWRCLHSSTMKPFEGV